MDGRNVSVVPESIIVPVVLKTDGSIASLRPPTLIPETSRPYNSGIFAVIGVNFAACETPPPKLR